MGWTVDYNIGEVLRADGQRYKIIGKIQYKNTEDNCRWMEYRLKNGGSLPYRYAMEYNGLHFGTEAQFSYDIHYWFGISKDDYTAAAQAVVP